MELRRAASPGADEPVTVLELFFDLVFAFIVTQVTSLVAESHGYLQAAAILVITWWIYDGYAWLASNVSPTTASTIIPLLIAMTGFLVMASAVPDAFHEGAWAFAIGYVLVVAVHAFSFAHSSLGLSISALLRAVAVSSLVAGLLVVAAALGDEWGWVCWLVGAGMIVGYLVFSRARGFSLRPAHFAERHRLLLIIALGETIIAIGAGASRRLGEWPVVLAVVLAMVLISALWWIFFVGDHHEQGERVLAETDPEARPERARWAYSVAHLVVISGLVFTAAGLHVVVHEPTHHLSLAESATLAGGVVAFLLGVVMFLRVLRVGSWVEPAVAAAVSAVTVLLGLYVGGLAQLGGLALVLIAAAAIRARTPRSIS